ncbi:MAG: SpoIID/LytB domain-containing protein [Acidobacteriota bacterium]|nr:SpoIID/LytB domain-containing protein [Acidobacteriota bacterium]MDE3263679.1 SpoIID/LytB domain-containing protein [Acidobacteriota bacterium]
MAKRWMTNLGLGATACLLLAAGPSPSTSPPSIVLPEQIRLGLATDLERVEVACCDGPSWLVDDAGRRVEVAGPFHVVAAPGKASPGVHRLQVAALRDRVQAERLAGRLAGLLGQEADSVLDAGTGLYRVRVGRFGGREAAEEARGRLHVEGFDDVWITVEGQVLEEPGFEVEGVGRVAGRRLRLESADGVVHILGSRYRGALEVFLSDRSGLNVVNAAPLEDYLRGVVPVELGPDLYPELEAIKAQAVAARTYAVKRLGEFESEGYDLCAGPLCQVYGGLDVEHPVSDEAIAATRGEILLRGGVPQEALFTASCGGGTELVDHVFPLLAGGGPTGTACVEGGVVTLAGGAEGSPARHLLKSLGIRRVRDRRVDERLSRARSAGDLEVVEGSLGGFDGGRLDLREQGRRRLVALAPGAALLLAAVGTEAPPGDLGVPTRTLAAAPGDRLRVYLARGRAVLIVHEAPKRRDQPAAERWSLWRSHDSVRAAAERRFPGLGLESLNVLERGVSGRVARIDLIGEQGTVELQGLAIRWLLDVPEHVVELTAETGEGGVPGWRFAGRGRGHGVGMCQVGSYLMAQRGLTYREILWHYYGAVDIGRFAS